MLMIIMGAGASYDSYASRPPVKESKEAYRPPLADELFEDRTEFNKLLKRFNKCQEILPQLREQSQKKLLEAFLETHRDEAKTFPRAEQQLRAVKYYIQAAITACEKGWREVHHGATNHLALINRVERWRSRQNESVSIVTFNYDTLIEEALGLYTEFSFQCHNDYIRRLDYRLFKLHGSVNWGHATQCALTEHEYEKPSIIEQKIIHGVNSTAVRIYPDLFEMDSATSRLRKEHLVLSPAIAIPTTNKELFECPKSHIDALSTAIPKVSRIIVIGWRAQEEHFLSYLKELSKQVRVLVVAKGTTDVTQTVETLKIAGVKGTYTDVKQGFSYLVKNSDVIDRFLSD